MNKLKSFVAVLAATALTCVPIWAQNYVLAPMPRLAFSDENGAPYASGKLCSYVSGTSTLTNTFSDAAGTPNSNPVTLSTRGDAVVFLDASIAYRLVLKSGGTPGSCSDGTTRWTQDSVSASPRQTRQIPGVLQLPYTGTVSGTAVVAYALTYAGSALSQSFTTYFNTPQDIVTTSPITLQVGYQANTSPGATNNKVKLTVQCTVNGTAGSSTSDTITLSNDTTPAVYTATNNVCAASTFSAGNQVSVSILRDVSVANNAAINFIIRALGFTYVSKQ